MCPGAGGPWRNAQQATPPSGCLPVVSAPPCAPMTVRKGRDKAAKILGGRAWGSKLTPASPANGSPLAGQLLGNAGPQECGEPASIKLPRLPSSSVDRRPPTLFLLLSTVAPRPSRSFAAYIPFVFLPHREPAARSALLNSIRTPARISNDLLCPTGLFVNIPGHLHRASRLPLASPPD
ncbi:hypothetical protein BCR34DRAFT_36668 [Clohesyomyces aquaticus]|uniref:Uncharacterized protein n=1 Tax=Clohesyomyces aquaticus TaxID=1231657 RepID=A0A1Y1Z7R0_9PLEO|nr:hypothetical protein BCR34DRAFT_36668 [Clohesyomyces aquaticus]